MPMPDRDSGYSDWPAIFASTLGTDGNLALSTSPALTDALNRAPPFWFQQPRRPLKQATARAVSPELA